MSVKVTRDEVIAFRLEAHHLNHRVSEDELLVAAGTCGVQNSPPGSALLALNARVAGVTEPTLNTAVSEDKTLLQSWSMRGAPFFFPTADLPIFTTGVLPPSEDAKRHFILGVEQSIDKLNMTLAELVDLTRDRIAEVLAGRRLTVNELGAEIAGQITHNLPRGRRTVWEQEGPHASGQSLGEGVIHFCLRILTLQRVICFAPRDGHRAPFVLLDEWLEQPVPALDADSARAELLRRYLHVYGPSTRADFASWLGVRSREGDWWWDLLREELTQVDFGDRAWILSDDLEALQSPPTPTGVRLLPPRDPYTQSRDRATIVDKRFHREVWKTAGEPGAALVDGRVVGTWRAPKKGRKLNMTITAFTPLSARTKQALESEANEVASLRGARSVDIEFDTY